MTEPILQSKNAFVACDGQGADRVMAKMRSVSGK